MLTFRWVLATLIVVATVAFAVGVIVERASGEHSKAAEGAEHQAREAQSGEHSEAEETGENQAQEAGGGSRSESEETAERRAREARGGESHSQTGESTEDRSRAEEIVGVNLESTPLVLLAVVVSLAMAAAILRWPGSTPLLVLVAVTMLAFAVLDVREVLQVRESRQGLAVLAGAVALLHALAAGLGGLRTARLRA